MPEHNHMSIAFDCIAQQCEACDTVARSAIRTRPLTTYMSDGELRGWYNQRLEADAAAARRPSERYTSFNESVTAPKSEK